MATSRKLYFENTRIGDEIPAVAKAPIDRVQLARYAGATEDFSPLAVDEVYARSVGLPSVIVPASLGMGFLGQVVTEWGRGGQLRRFSTRFSRPLRPGDTLVIRGRVSDRHGEGGKYFVEVEIWAENQRGELALRGSVTLQVFYSAEDEARFRAGQPPIVVNVARESLLTPTPVPAPAAQNRMNGKKVPPKPAKPAQSPVTPAPKKAAAKKAAPKKAAPKKVAPKKVAPKKAAPKKAAPKKAAPKKAAPKKATPKPKPKPKAKPKKKR